MVLDRVRAQLDPEVEIPKRAHTLAAQAPVIEIPSRGIDLILFAALVALIGIGTIEVFSSSAVYAYKRYGDSAYFLKRQLVWLTLGFGALWIGAVTDYRWLKRYTYPLLATALALLGGVLLFGATINSAKRWFILGPLSFQPVELAKLALICYLAYSLSKKADKLKTFTVGFVPHLLVCAIMMLLLMKQPDLGSSIILGATTLIMLFVAGTKISYIGLAVLAAAPVAYHLIVDTPWRMQRFMAYFNPEAYRSGVAYQIVQSRIAIGSGGTTGTGLGEGRQQLGYMPEGHSDFIMSSIGEEMGFIGFTLVLGLFVVIVWRGVRAALGSRDTFGSYLAFGITVSFALQALINTGVVLGVLPAKGLTLPFVSYGGSSLVMSMFLAGIVLNVARRRGPISGRRRELVNFQGAKRRKRRVVVACGS
jgi:cell division protein FtsW